MSEITVYVNEAISVWQSRNPDLSDKLEIQLLEDGLRKEGSWWYAPLLIRNGSTEISRRVRNDIFADLENEIEERHETTVLFIPVLEDQVA